MEPQYGGEIKDGTYVRSNLGNGIYYVHLSIYRKMGLCLMEMKPKLMEIYILSGKINN